MKWISFLWKKYIPAIIPFENAQTLTTSSWTSALNLKTWRQNIKCDARFPTTKYIFSSLTKKMKSDVNIIMHSIQTIWPYVLENTALSYSSGPIRFINASRDTTAWGFLLLWGAKLAARHRRMASGYLPPHLKSEEKWKNVVRRDNRTKKKGEIVASLNQTKWTLLFSNRFKC